MQTDPVFAERAGFDAYDPYSYVASNPVNFTDPTGKKWTWDALSKPMRIIGTNIGNSNIGKGMKTIGTNIGNSNIGEGIKTIGKNIGNETKWVSGGLRRAADVFKNNHWSGGPNMTHEEVIQFYILYETSGMTPEAFVWLWSIADLLGGSKDDVWFDHNYSGDGNRDKFANFNHVKNRGAATRDFFLAMYVLSQNDSPGNPFYGNPDAMKMATAFYLMIPMLSVKPKTFADTLAVYHDRNVPGSSANGWFCKDGGKGFNTQMMKANFGYASRWIGGIGTKRFWDQPVDSILVGGVASVGFAVVENHLRFYTGAALCP